MVSHSSKSNDYFDNKSEELFSALSSLIGNLRDLNRDELLDKLIDCVNYLVEFTQPDYSYNDDELPF